MRILLTVHAFPPASTAGVEVYTLRLATALRDLGHELLVLSAVHDLGAAPYSVRRRTYQGVEVAEVVNVHHLGTLEATLEDPHVDAAAAEVLREFRPHCVHLQHLLNLSTGLVAEAKRVGAGIVLTLHDYWLSCPRDGLRMRADLTLCQRMDHRVCASCLQESPYLVPPLQRFLSGTARRAGLGSSLHRLHDLTPRTVERALGLLRRVAPGRSGLATAMDRRANRLRAALVGVDLFLAPTSFARDRALEFGVAVDRLRVSPLGAVPGSPRPRRPGPRRRLGFVGTVAPHKGVHVLVEAFHALEAPGATLDLHGSVTGHPAYVDGLRRAVAGDPRIRFCGPFPEGDQQRILADLDAIVLPSVWWEYSPLTIPGAPSAGLPVVASAIGGIPEIVRPGTAGLLKPPGDALALKRALSDVIEGRSLTGGVPPLPLKTVSQGATELVGVYESLARSAVRA